MTSDLAKPPKIVTLGPEGTCHERAVRAYLAFQGIEDFEVEFIADFLDGLERIRGEDHAFLVQCSAHPKVHEVTERYWREVFVVDTFIYPTKHLVVLTRREVERPAPWASSPQPRGTSTSPSGRRWSTSSPSPWSARSS